MIESEKRSSSPLVVVVAWFVVLAPLSWGVIQSVAKSLPLFEPPAAPRISSESELN